MASVRGMKGGKAGGPSGIHAEDLKLWIWEATRKKEPARRRWDLFVVLVQ